MTGGGEYEPKDSRRVVGTRGDRRSWRKQENPRKGRGEYEPYDARNVTGTASTPDGRWTGPSTEPPDAEGQPPKPAPEKGADNDKE